MMVAAPILLLASPKPGTGVSICSLFENIDNVLNTGTIAVVAVSLIIAGYMCAFAHKRIADMVPTVIGGLMIGASVQIAKLLMPDQAECVESMTAWIHTLLGPYV